jgi:hypothetical protein
MTAHMSPTSALPWFAQVHMWWCACRHQQYASVSSVKQPGLLPSPTQVSRRHIHRAAANACRDAQLQCLSLLVTLLQPLLLAAAAHQVNDLLEVHCHTCSLQVAVVC